MLQRGIYTVNVPPWDPNTVHTGLGTLNPLSLAERFASKMGSKQRAEDKK